MMNRILQVAILILASITVSAGEQGLVIMKDLQGHLTLESRSNVRQLAHQIRASGPITVWASYEMEFVGNPNLRTSEVEFLESQERLRLYHEVILPLIEEGLIQEQPRPGPPSQAPGILLTINKAKGLKKLANDPRVRHITQLIAEQ